MDHGRGPVGDRDTWHGGRWRSVAAGEVDAPAQQRAGADGTVAVDGEYAVAREEIGRALAKHDAANLQDRATSRKIATMLSTEELAARGRASRLRLFDSHRVLTGQGTRRPPVRGTGAGRARCAQRPSPRRGGLNPSGPSSNRVAVPASIREYPNRLGASASGAAG